jgi:hypothetical protein
MSMAIFHNNDMDGIHLHAETMLTEDEFQRAAAAPAFVATV